MESWLCPHPALYIVSVVLFSLTGSTTHLYDFNFYTFSSPRTILTTPSNRRAIPLDWTKKSHKSRSTLL